MGIRRFVAPLASSVLLATPAGAQPPAAAPSAVAPPALPAPAAPPPAPPPASASVTVPGGYTCEVGEHAGVDADDAHTTADVVCNDLASHHAQPGAYDIRVGKLGGKLLLVVVERASGNERRLFIQGAEEIPTASERLVTALVTNKPVAQTEGVDTVVSSEATAPLQKPATAGVFLGVTGMSGLGAAAGLSAGIQIDIEFRVRSIGLELQGRTGGVSSGDNAISYGSLGAGGRYFFSDADISPFAGGGLTFAYFHENQSQGSGFGAAAEVGVSFFRSSRAGALVALRADLPMFTLNSTTYQADGSASTSSQYVVPLSLNVGLLLH